MGLSRCFDMLSKQSCNWRTGSLSKCRADEGAFGLAPRPGGRRVSTVSVDDADALAELICRLPVPAEAISYAVQLNFRFPSSPRRLRVPFDMHPTSVAGHNDILRHARQSNQR
jgi:hypothetical protein